MEQETGNGFGGAGGANSSTSGASGGGSTSNGTGSLNCGVGGGVIASGGSEESDPQLFQPVVPEDARDGIAEPIYHLIGEVFELRGVFGWLRRTLVTFAQITYGRTLNR